MGPACPADLVEVSEGKTVADPAGVEWFRMPDAGWTISEGIVEFSQGYRVVADHEPRIGTVVYLGSVTRSDDGVVTYTR